MESIIKEGCSFNSVNDKIGLLEYKEAIEYYSKNWEEAKDLKNDIPIFLDTNVLLRYYSISFKKRELLKKFFNDRKEQIILSNQVQKEFVKNREGVIEEYFQDALKKLLDEFKTIINQIKSFNQKHKEIIKDFEFLETQTSEYQTNLEKSSEDLKNAIKEKRQEKTLTKFNDEILDLFSSFELIDNLTEDEIEYLKKEFDCLKKELDPQKIKNEIKKPNRAFPGMGDIQDKPDNPYGDYYLFHEMIKYSKENDKDVVLITYDTTKGDWIKENKEAHIHYIQRVYQMNKKAVFIIDANWYFEELFDTSFDSLIFEDNVATNNLLQKRKQIADLYEYMEHALIEIARILGIGVEGGIISITAQLASDGFIKPDVYSTIISLVKQIENIEEIIVIYPNPDAALHNIYSDLQNLNSIFHDLLLSMYSKPIRLSFKNEP